MWVRSNKPSSFQSHKSLTKNLSQLVIIFHSNWTCVACSARDLTNKESLSTFVHPMRAYPVHFDLGLFSPWCELGLLRPFHKATTQSIGTWYYSLHYNIVPVSPLHFLGLFSPLQEGATPSIIIRNLPFLCDIRHFSPLHYSGTFCQSLYGNSLGLMAPLSL